MGLLSRLFESRETEGSGASSFRMEVEKND